MKKIINQLKNISPQKVLSIIGVSILIVVGVMITKIDPTYLQASFFGRFFPKTEAPVETEPATNDLLGFYRFDELQTKYFPVPDTKQVNEALNYDFTPATFSPFQDSFIQLWEEWVGNNQNPGTMIVSNDYTSQHDDQYTKIVKIIKDTHTQDQPKAAELIKKTCKKQISSEPCE